MTDARSAWSETGEHLSALGSRLGAHFEQQREPDDLAGLGDEGEKPRSPAGDTIKKVGDAAQAAFEAAGAAARDQSVRDDAKQVGRSLLGALDATFREVSAEVRKVVDRNTKDDESPAPAGPGADRPAEPVVNRPAETVVDRPAEPVVNRPVEPVVDEPEAPSGPTGLS